jgi:hypothetical protein
MWPTSPPVQPTSAKQPPPISGGTLLILKDGRTAVASDADLDRVWFVDLAVLSVVGSAALQAGDEPGRVVEDAVGRVHVVLRRGGAVATINPADASVTRRAVCPAPRGIAYDDSNDLIHVACLDGSLVTLPAAGGDAVRSVFVDGDLRDVVIQNGTLYVTRFRAAELVELASDGTIAQRITPPVATGTPVAGPMPGPGPMTSLTASPSVAYRTVGLPGGGLAMLHQRAQEEAVATQPGGYAGFGMCPGVGIVHDTITLITPGAVPAVSAPLAMVSVAVDLAVSGDGSQAAVAMPSGLGPSVGVFPLPLPTFPPGAPAPCLPPSNIMMPNGQAIAVAFNGENQLVAQLRAPSALMVGPTTIALSNADTSNDGMSIFYQATKGGIACASCHPEAGDDGRVWQFQGLGPRRTQNIRGGVLARTPFHWSGDIANMDNLVSVVFVGRMVGPQLTETQTMDLGQWMDAQPAIGAPPTRDVLSVARGKATFEDPSVGCATCHSGPQLSTHALVDVGTGGTFKVPSLIAVRYRAPYLHNGCASTLLDRFSPACGGGDMHGHTSQLDAGQLSDLIAYLASL